ncbi:MAG TPA: exonuclease domain-containing protein [Euzebya sp.]|nr:exonuclease domain-containing protein [Euzebya sp.]
MRARARFALAVAGLSAAALGAAALATWLVWEALDAAARDAVAAAAADRALALGLVASGVVVGIALALQAPFRTWTAPARRLIEEGRLILLANPGHRVRLGAGAQELVDLAGVVNELAEHGQQALAEVEAQIEDARAEVAEERNRLVALMSQLPQAVLVCSAEGRILLYNGRTVALLEGESEDGSGGYVGLDRSLHALVDADALAFALAEVQRRLGAGEDEPVSTFVTAAGGGRLLRAQLAPVRAEEPAAGGYVLTLEDVTRRLEAGNRREVLLRSLIERTRAAVASVRAAVETIAAHPDMESDQRDAFTGIIADEALRLSGDLDAAATATGAHLDASWPLDDMLGSDLLAALRSRLAGVWAVDCAVMGPPAPVWLRVDGHALLAAVATVAERVVGLGPISAASIGVEASGGLARLDVSWRGPAPEPAAFAGWETARPDGRIPLTLKEVTERHAGEVLYRRHPQGDGGMLRLLLPAGEPAARPTTPGPREQRVAGYDLRMLQRVDRASDLDERPLDQLTCTVFDTETTGLAPAEGDEIIAIGAVRIVRGRLQRHERFSQLVDPQRHVSAASFRIHGIDDEMLAGRPTLPEVVPAFARFCDDTVLVGHNVAFDLRFLELAEGRTGVRFDQPVLDTLLLSAVIAPEQADHSLDALAARLGVDVVARHTALGDALLTAQVLLRLLPLLADHGITMLGQAREAAAQTPHATLGY